MFAKAATFAYLRRISPGRGSSQVDVSLVVMPLFHMGGLAWALSEMASGVQNVIVRDFVAADVLDTIVVEGATVTFCVPAMLADLCSALEAQPRDLTLRRMVYSGAPISTRALNQAMRLLDCDFVQLSGLTEATGAFAQLSSDEHDPAGKGRTSCDLRVIRIYCGNTSRTKRSSRRGGARRDNHFPPSG